MSRKNPQDYQVLNQTKFQEYCSVLGCKELSCYDPEKRAIERAFRKRALKTHPDKGGDPIEFKKINDAYYRLMGHCAKLEQQAEEQELANSILIEVSKASLPKWTEKLKRCYGYPKSDSCKGVFFEGPYKQFKGKSRNTGPITLVLYEDPPDAVPKIHVICSKYMAWIAEQMMPVHMHVEKGRSIQFDQWRIAHLAEFGICNFATPGSARPPPAPAATTIKTPKAKRKAQDASEPRSKARRDSEPTPEPTPGQESSPPSPPTPPENNKENKEPDMAKKPEDGSTFSSGKKCPEAVGEKEAKESEKSSAQDPFPKLYNMAQQSFTKDGKAGASENGHKKKTDPSPKAPEPRAFRCDKCGTGFRIVVDYMLHQQGCRADQLVKEMEDAYGEYLGPKPPASGTAAGSEARKGKKPENGKGGVSQPEANKASSSTANGNLGTQNQGPGKVAGSSAPAGEKKTPLVENGSVSAAEIPPKSTTTKGDKHGSGNGTSRSSGGGGHAEGAKITRAGDVAGSKISNGHTNGNCGLEDNDVIMPEEPPRGGDVHVVTNKNGANASDKTGANNNNKKIQLDSLRESLPTAQTSSECNTTTKTTSPQEPDKVKPRGDAPRTETSDGGNVKQSGFYVITGKTDEKTGVAKESVLAEKMSSAKVVKGEKGGISDALQAEQMTESCKSAVKNIPTTSNVQKNSQMAGLKQSDSQFLCTQITKAPPKVNDSLLTGSEASRGHAKARSPLDAEAIKLSDKIFSMGQVDLQEEAARHSPPPSKSKAKLTTTTFASRTEMGGSRSLRSLDQEAILLSNSILVNTNDQEEASAVVPSPPCAPPALSTQKTPTQSVASALIPISATQPVSAPISVSIHSVASPAPAATYAFASAAAPPAPPSNIPKAATAAKDVSATVDASALEAAPLATATLPPSARTPGHASPAPPSLPPSAKTPGPDTPATATFSPAVRAPGPDTPAPDKHPHAAHDSAPAPPSYQVQKSTQPSFGFSTTARPYQNGEMSASALDQEAIRLSNQIFLNTTDPLPPPPSQPNTLDRIVESLRRPTTEGPAERPVLYAKESYLINNPVRDQPSVSNPAKSSEKNEESLTRTAARVAPPVSQEVNRHRPAHLGPSRFDRPGSSSGGVSSRPMTASTQLPAAANASSTGKAKITDSPTSILRSEHAQQHPRPARNVTVLDSRTLGNTEQPQQLGTTNSSSRAVRENFSLAQSATFAYGSRPSTGHSSSAGGRNFNTSPVPFSADSGKYSVHLSTSNRTKWTGGTGGLSASAADSDLAAKSAANYSPPPQPGRYGASVTFSESVGHSSGPSSQLTSASGATGSSASLASAHRHGATASSKVPSAGLNSRTVLAAAAAFRAKSEGASSGLQASSSHVSLASSAASAELFRQIQVTKERHRENCEKAMNFGGGSAAAVAAAWKPPAVGAAKLPRPGHDYARYATTVERDKVTRRLERERSVMDKILSDRSSRAVSLENNGAYKTLV